MASALAKEYERRRLLGPNAVMERLRIDRNVLQLLVAQKQLQLVAFEWKGKIKHGYPVEAVAGKVAVYRDGRVQLTDAE